MKIEEMPISTVKWIPVDELSANDYNPNVVYTPEMKLLALSILKNGWIQPVLVTQNNVIIDGYHRSTLCRTDEKVRKLTDGKVPCVVMNLSEADRMLLTIRINRAKGQHIALKMSDIIHKLVNELGVTIDEVCKQIGATRDEIDLLLMDNVFAKKNITEESKFSTAWKVRPK